MLQRIRASVVRAVRLFVKEYIRICRQIASASGITSIKLIFEPQMHLIERIFWTVIVFGSMGATYILIMNQINRYQLSPTVMSLDRDYRAWNGTMPGLTLCYKDHINYGVASQIIYDKFNVTADSDEYMYFLDFLTAAVSASAYNYAGLVPFAEDERFEDINMHEIVRDLDRAYEQKLSTFNESINVQVRRVMTERGMCYAINAPMSVMLSQNQTNIRHIEKPIHCQYGKHQCFIKMDLFESTGTIEVHSPYEVSASDAGVGAIELIKLDEVIASYKVVETFASKNLRDLTLSQRKCVFYDEPAAGLPIYSKTLCLSRCRAVMALEMCQCVPFFYPFVEGPSCSPSGFECLMDFKWPIWALHVCKCPSTCSEHVYSVSSVKRSSWGGTSDENQKMTCSFRWEIIPPKVRMRRDVVFNFEDLLVSIGGAIGLFLGASFLTLLRVGIVSVQWIADFIIDIVARIRIYCTNLYSRKLFNRRKISTK